MRTQFLDFEKEVRTMLASNQQLVMQALQQQSHLLSSISAHLEAGNHSPKKLE